jgi:putative addiction module component (TIGR02574 family)
MTAAATRVLEDALQLEAPERAEIVEELLVSLDDDSRRQIETAWAAEIQRRAADARANPHDEIDWRDALRDVEREVFGR